MSVCFFCFFVFFLFFGFGVSHWSIFFVFFFLFFCFFGFGVSHWSIFFCFFGFALHGSFLQNTILRSCFESYTSYTHPSNLWLAMPLLPRACAAAKPKPYPTSWPQFLRTTSACIGAFYLMFDWHLHWPQFPENHICLCWSLLPHVRLTSALSSFRPTDDDEPMDTESDGQEHLGSNNNIWSYMLLYSLLDCRFDPFSLSWLHHVCLLNCLPSASSTPPQDRWRQHAWDTA